MTIICDTIHFTCILRQSRLFLTVRIYSKNYISNADHFPDSSVPTKARHKNQMASRKLPVVMVP
jgi:hypothetical protein